MTTVFKVEGIKGKQRPRFANGHTYTPKETQLYEQAVGYAYRGKRFSKETPIAIEITVYYEIPKSCSKVKRNTILLEQTRPIKKPDIDNIAKIVLDGLNGVAYEDDSQVIKLIVNKYWTEASSNICVKVYTED